MHTLPSTSDVISPRSMQVISIYLFFRMRALQAHVLPCPKCPMVVSYHTTLNCCSPIGEGMGI